MRRGSATGCKTASPTRRKATARLKPGRIRSNGDTTNLLTETRNAGASYFIPTENEWYKAAYYDPTLNGGAGGYWAYPTKSNTAPGNLTAPTPATMTNYYNNDYTDPLDDLTPVGDFVLSPGGYGTYDMGGDVWQWNEANYGRFVAGYTWRGFQRWL